MKKLLFNTMAIALLCLFSISTYAQEATAASTYNEGLAMLKAKDYANGLAKMESALALATEGNNEKIIGLAKKNGAVAAYNVGNAARKAKDYDGAMAAYNKGIELNPKYSSIYEGIGRTLEAKGDKLAAVKEYLKAATMAKEEGKEKKVASRLKKVKTLVGKTYVAKDYDLALQMGDEYLKSDDKNADVYYYMARAQQAKKDNEAAATHMAKAIELDGANSKYLFYQGEILEAKGDKAGAAAAYKKVTEEKYKKQAEYRAGKLAG